MVMGYKSCFILWRIANLPQRKNTALFPVHYNVNSVCCPLVVRLMSACCPLLKRTTSGHQADNKRTYGAGTVSNRGSEEAGRLKMWRMSCEGSLRSVSRCCGRGSCFCKKFVARHKCAIFFVFLQFPILCRYVVEMVENNTPTAVGDGTGGPYVGPKGH